MRAFNGYRWCLTAPAVAALIALTACGAPASPAAEPAAPAPTSSAPAMQPPQQTPATTAATASASPPVSLSITAIDLETELLSLGLRDNKSLEVPSATENNAPASWYNGSPIPGTVGPSVMLGHVNSPNGTPGVFAGLRDLAPGDPITVTSQDGQSVSFTVDRGAAYSKADFPTFEVYGNTAGPELRLITCDGYDPATGLFDDNYVIYAKIRA